jgi:hypothetical protein
MNLPEVPGAARAPTRNRPDSKIFRQIAFSTKPTTPLGFATPHIATGCRSLLLARAFVARLAELGGSLS